MKKLLDQNHVRLTALLAAAVLLFSPLVTFAEDKEPSETKKVGEASYNIADCEVTKENGKSKDEDTKKIDLDKCRKVKK